MTSVQRFWESTDLRLCHVIYQCYLNQNPTLQQRCHNIRLLAGYPLAMRGHSALQGFPHSLPDHQGAHRSQRQLPLYLSPSHPVPSPLAVLPPYLPLCAPSQPIEAINTPCMGEGAMIIATQIPTYDTTRIGYICPIHTYFTPILVHLFMETFGDLSEF